MDAVTGDSGGKYWLRLLVGIQTGTLGGILMLIWLVIMAPVIGDPPWLMVNLFASTLYGQIFRTTIGMQTVVGSAVHLISCGILGGLNGLLTPGGRLFGLGLAAVWYAACYLFLWKRIAPMILTHGSQPLLMAGYFLLGSALGQQGSLLARARS